MDIAKDALTEKPTLIKNAKKGIKYRCVGCGKRVIARLGKRREHHFAHMRGEGSDSCGQTALHEMAKIIFMDIKEFVTPAVVPRKEFFNSGSSFEVMKSNKVRIADVRLEKYLGSYRPDVLIQTGDNNIICVEVYVSHKVDDEKLSKIRNMHIETLELDLSSVDREISYKELREGIIEGRYPMRWLYNENLSSLLYLQSLRSVLLTDSTSDSVCCPMLCSDKRGGNLSKREHCYGCPFFEKHYSPVLDACYVSSLYGSVSDLDYPRDSRLDFWRLKFSESIAGSSLKMRDLDKFLEMIESKPREGVRYFRVSMQHKGKSECIAHSEGIGKRLYTKDGYKVTCPLCGSDMVFRVGKQGVFAACSSYVDTGCTGNRDMAEISSYRR